MSRNGGYRNVKKKNKRGFTVDIRPDVDAMLDIWCRVNNVNKTHYVNDLIYRDMYEKFQVLREV